MAYRCRDYKALETRTLATKLGISLKRPVRRKYQRLQKSKRELCAEINRLQDDFAWPIEKTLGTKTIRGRKFIQVKWFGFHDTTWEPIENIRVADEQDDNDRPLNLFMPNVTQVSYYLAFLATNRVPSECMLLPLMHWNATEEMLWAANNKVTEKLLSDAFDSCFTHGTLPTFMYALVFLYPIDDDREWHTPVHANVLIYHRPTRMLYIYDPHTLTEPEYKPQQFHDTLLRLFRAKPFSVKNQTLKTTWYSYCPDTAGENIFLGLQTEFEDDRADASDPQGYCVAWSLWRLEVQFATASYIPPKKLNDHMAEMLVAKSLEMGVSQYDFIRLYASSLARETFHWASRLIAQKRGRKAAADFEQQWRRANETQKQLRVENDPTRRYLLDENLTDYMNALSDYYEVVRRYLENAA